MKKVLVFGLSLLLIIAMNVPAFAALGGFIYSPGRNKGPELIEYDNESHECTATLVVTPYAERHTLNEEKRNKLEEAYSIIVNTTDVTTLNDDLAEVAKKNNLDSKKLAISDLFDVSYYSCDIHNEHGAFTITIKPDYVKNFVGLLHLNGDEWELVSNAKVEKRGEDELLTFTVDELSPFAIVVNTDTTPAPTGDSFQWIFYIAMMAVSAAALIVIGFKLKAQEN
jgi:hypothetical protein